VVEVQNFLKRFGYLDAAFAEGRTPEPGRLDEVTVDALTAYQRFYKPLLAELGKVGTPGTLDALTREVMATPRVCGMPDVLPGDIPPGPAFRYNLRCAWDRRFFRYGFGQRTMDVGYLAQTGALRRAFQTWAAAGVGISLSRAYTDPWEDPDFLVKWRPAVDPPDVNLKGAGAFADFPATCSGPTRPKQIRFNDSDYTWNTNGAMGGFDIETTALHEIGHLLGLDHTTVPGNIMLAVQGEGMAQHTLGADDLAGLRALYPPDLPSKNRITSVHSGQVLDVWDGKPDNQVPIVQWPWWEPSSRPNQRFRVEAVYEPAAYRFVAEHSGKVLTVKGVRTPSSPDNTADEAPIIQFDWQGQDNANQKFRVEAIGNPGDGYRITALHSGKALDVPRFSTVPGEHIWQFHVIPGARNQLWRFD
jgi:hypothetical protein